MPRLLKSILFAWLLCCLAGCVGPTPLPSPTPLPPTPNLAQPELGLQPTQFSQPFENIPAHALIYQVNIRAFSPSGDLAGIIDRLDQIKALGVNVIYLMPIYPIGKINSVNSPYSVQNYFQVNPEFGDLTDLRTLTEEAHKRDMAVILDWVANHTSWDNPWIANKSWYTQKNGKIISPEGTNWNDVADLNYANKEMRAAMIQALTYWVLEANIDGYRFDAADLVPFDFWQQALTALNAIPGRKLILLAEGAREDHFAAGFQMNYAWSFYDQLKLVYTGQPATTLYTTHLNEYKNLPEGKAMLRFTTNHDKSAWDASPIKLFNGKNGALAASIITTYMGGVPMIYSGQEVGRADTTPFFSKSPINWDENPDMLQAYQMLLKFYLNSPALLEGDLQDCSGTDVVCFTRSAPGEDVAVIVNVRNKPIDFILPSTLQNTSWMNGFTGRPVVFETQLSLEPYAYLVVKK